jgi:peptidoglycan/xylan/chitin deacetylase (PgdA/CDA1 family)
MEYSPRLMIAFDDNRSTAYDIAYPYMHDRGLRGTVFAIKNTTGLSNYMTLENLQALYADGWAVANHTVSHTGNGLIDYDLTGQTAELSGCTDWLIANGIPRAAHHVAYPLGAYNDITMTALAALGMITGRTSYNYQQYTPINNPYLINGRTVYSTDTLSTVKGYIDAAYNKGVSLQLIFHKLLTETDSTTTWWTPANFQALIDYILARKIPCVTIDEWYKGLTNPRYRSLPLVRAVV